jgi:hypothetical protein
MVVGIYDQRKHYTRNVHRLVLSAFNPNDDKTLVACHNNDVKTNNNLNNLRWDTQKANVHDAHRNGVAPVHERHWAAKLNWIKVGEIRKLASEGRPVLKIAAEYGVNERAIYGILKGETWVKN